MDNRENNKKVVVRFAPSPTGRLHIGGARTALFNWLYAKKHDGTMLLRIEDTDRARSKVEYEEIILTELQWLGMEEAFAPFRQSERTDIYKRYIEKLIEEDKAYVSKEEVTEESQREEVIRFRNPGKTIAFDDIIRGEITVDTTDLGDIVIARSIDEPVYHLTVVVDDFEMGITHIIRAEEHISNTPRHILIQEAIGAPRPEYAHVPLILAPDRTKLSKRHGATSLSEYKDMGFLPDAIANYLVLLGWNPGTDQEIFTIEELVQAFDLSKVQKGGAIFDLEKLRWVNKEHIKRLDGETFLQYVELWLPEDIKILPNYSTKRLVRVLPVIQERIEILSDIKKLAEEGELEYFFEAPEYFTHDLLWKDDKDPDHAIEYLSYIFDTLGNLGDDLFTAEHIKLLLWDYATEKGRGNVLWPFRYALSGRDRSPDPFQLAEILSKEETLLRIRGALKKLSEERV